MSDFKDSSIKLFGQTINLSSLHQNHQFTDLENSEYEEETCATTITTASSTSGAIKKPKTCSPEASEIESLIQANPEKVEPENEEEKEKETILKKPEKILCPRCKSTDTKFCYYNNYNVNQPRHLCKKCQRYWTAGGSIRNIPVGAGRRKSKASAFRQIMLSESMRVQAAINGLQDPYLATNNSTTFLTFGRDQTKEQTVGKSNQKFIGKVPYVSDGIFNGFSPSLVVLQANPAALCRSLDFHESN